MSRDLGLERWQGDRQTIEFRLYMMRPTGFHLVSEDSEPGLLQQFVTRNGIHSAMIEKAMIAVGANPSVLITSSDVPHTTVVDVDGSEGFNPRSNSSKYGNLLTRAVRPDNRPHKIESACPLLLRTCYHRFWSRMVFVLSAVFCDINRWFIQQLLPRSVYSRTSSTM